MISSDELPPLIAQIKPGQTAQLEIWRDKAVKRINVTVEELKEKTSVAEQPRRWVRQCQGETAVVNRIGLSVRALTPTEKSQLKTRGSIVVVDANGAAAEAGSARRRRHPEHQPRDDHERRSVPEPP